MNKQQLAAKIWESANRMRGKVDASEYKDFILGFIFYKYLSEKEEQFFLAEGMTAADMEQLTEEDEETVGYAQRRLGYFIDYKNLFSTWVAAGNDFAISQVYEALSAFSRLVSPTYQKVFKDVFVTLQTGLSKLGDATSQTRSVRDLIHLVQTIPMHTRQDYDVLGYIYEDLISKFASSAGKKAGEFYTPHEVSELMSEIVADHLRNQDEIRIYDPTSGSGSLLITIGEAVKRRMGNEDGIIYYAQELNQSTFNLTRMNLVMRGIKPSNLFVRNGDTLEEDWPYFDDSDPSGTYDPLYVDAVVSNPPYSQRWEPEGKDADIRFAYGIAPRSKADYAFLLHDLYHLKPSGIMCIVLPHGVLFRGGEEGNIRRNLIENDKIAAIIGLPANIFFGTGIPTIIMVLRQKRTESDVLIVDASKGFEKAGKSNRLRASDIRRIVDVVDARQTVEGFSRLVGKEEIRANDYNLNIPRYVDSSEPTETWDLYSTMFGGIPRAEIDALDTWWQALPGLHDALFASGNDHAASLRVDNLSEAVACNEAVRSYIKRYQDAFSGLRRKLVSDLIGRWDAVDSLGEEESVASDIFQRVSDFSLVDKYEAYQVLDNAWEGISADLEMLQTEGFDATRRVDPLMVLKKKGGKDVEVQDGWKGHVLPFGLVQEALLSDELSALRTVQDELIRVSGECDSLKEELPPEDDGDGEEASCDLTDEEIEERQQLLAEATKRQKSLKKAVKERTEALEDATRTLVESLTDEQVYELLERKWVDPLMGGLMTLPQQSIDRLVKKIEALQEKYQDTYADIAGQISDAERELNEMLGQLVGDEFDMLGIAELRKLLGGE
ncbi:type I restriction-modification system subunit M [Adlercreutzia muris]|uniref:site-specific DNA-methyltransferase (adenine-specific) n=1 Tax=Adlercreutzia muris TaxID=1796610 RepID=A0A7C8BRK2_9ACTN|nr:type I restriction-modification system subunit M [Adlercreutzia muris]KAB1650850.1 type I restriction-modification system subunit M [Adlercreutzia muris]MCR2028079.1 type I restriction-modification system subunit M [Adlercreutzia muris]MCU7584932.1 type I restriction-modification system subunit M [Adlercreutzia muris]